jgi:hypothetical protein
LRGKFDVTARSFNDLVGLLLLSMGCGNRNAGRKILAGTSQISESVGQPAYIKFRSFQNSDSIRGFAIQVNSKPYLHHRIIPLPGADMGFRSKKDTEKVADLFVEMIRDTDTSPELNFKQLDSLEILNSK